MAAGRALNGQRAVGKKREKKSALPSRKEHFGNALVALSEPLPTTLQER
jgi:hypothetical protein